MSLLSRTAAPSKTTGPRIAPSSLGTHRVKQRKAAIGFILNNHTAIKNLDKSTIMMARSLAAQITNDVEQAKALKFLVERLPKETLEQQKDALDIICLTRDEELREASLKHQKLNPTLIQKKLKIAQLINENPRNLNKAIKVASAIENINDQNDALLELSRRIQKNTVNYEAKVQKVLLNIRHIDSRNMAILEFRIENINYFSKKPEIMDETVTIAAKVRGDIIIRLGAALFLVDPEQEDNIIAILSKFESKGCWAPQNMRAVTSKIIEARPEPRVIKTVIKIIQLFGEKRYFVKVMQRLKTSNKLRTQEQKELLAPLVEAGIIAARKANDKTSEISLSMKLQALQTSSMSK